MSKKYVYLFQEGDASQRQLLGGKGANLAEMTRIGLPVPPGFTITTEACNEYLASGKQFPAGLWEQVEEKLAELERQVGKRFGGRPPLLVSVRSGAPVSMPGMMDTILNLGLNDTTVEYHAEATGDPRFAWDCYRRFIQMFGNVVLGIAHHRFEEIFFEHKRRAGVEADYQVPAEALRRVVEDYKALVRQEAGREFPQEPREQLRLAIQAVFESWNNPRAIVYRQVNKIPDDLGTAVNVQSMVFGNMGMDSGTGVVFTRNPSTGAKEFYGEYLLNAQGEDVVAGIRTPQPVAVLERELPAAYDQLYRVCHLLEQHFKEMQDIEFTIERGKLYMLQCRTGKRTAQAAIKIAVDMVHEGLITREEALLRVEPAQVEKILYRSVDPNAQLDVLATGLPASPGAAVGEAVFDPDRAEQLAREGRRVILVRPETTPDDIHGIVAAQGVLTSRGGMTSHAAIVARGMGKPAVVGCEAIRIDLAGRSFSVNGRTVREGDVISLDGGTGNVMWGAVPLVDPELSPEFRELLAWADEVRTLGVRANADTPVDAQKAREFGAEGIGLCRTEHMFGQGGYHPERMPVVQEMVLAETAEERRAALDKLLPMQREDFYGIFKAMEGLPVTIRLLDPPLHEFLPHQEQLAVEVAVLRATGGDPAQLEQKERLLRKVRALAEMNPMLGFRGCRLGMIFPEIYEMQARAIFEAAVQLVREGLRVEPEVMIPLVSHVEELRRMRQLVEKTAEAVFAETGVRVRYTVGTMIEVPRACVTADEIAAEAEFFSFGTNDLTQTAFGFSRDDAEGKFLAAYLQQKVLRENPFVALDQPGVGRLMEIAVELGRKTRPDIKLGICGEHGGEPSSVDFCHRAGLTYVSASPLRVPIARLAAAQAAIRHGRR
ncbi:pyruvate, phosphate dikinase [Caldinitratiruptor microaerophilus]|uniref:Pyruvate, phosphate dikinase n=1 Tax=Caldinitratiruptor microaerophilus TaxID=671077 RepID=A0AA35G8T4_9FIRM|nr:pyruvate, phosphate dikinase [Caldinitratiruptor microaerophilus]BDG61370.1 pyruvate, phosphate dikinase [Caldinitratiruptor microaerophilus]